MNADRKQYGDILSVASDHTQVLEGAESNRRYVDLRGPSGLSTLLSLSRGSLLSDMLGCLYMPREEPETGKWKMINLLTTSTSDIPCFYSGVEVVPSRQKN